MPAEGHRAMPPSATRQLLHAPPSATRQQLHALAARLENAENLSREDVAALNVELERLTQQLLEERRGRTLCGSGSKGIPTTTTTTSTASPDGIDASGEGVGAWETTRRTRAPLRTLAPPLRSESRPADIDGCSGDEGSEERGERDGAAAVGADGRGENKGVCTSVASTAALVFRALEFPHEAALPLEVSLTEEREVSDGDDDNDGCSSMPNYARALEGVDAQQLIFTINALSAALARERQAKRTLLADVVQPMQVALADILHENSRLSDENRSLRAALEAFRAHERREEEQESRERRRAAEAGANALDTERAELFAACREVARKFEASLPPAQTTVIPPGPVAAAASNAAILS